MALSERTKKLLDGGEGVDVEYKTSVTQEFNEVLVAFANGKGGVCLFGVEDHKDASGRHIGKIVGIEISDRTRGRIQSRSDQTIDKIDIFIESEIDDDGKGIYIITIEEGKSKPYCTGGGRYLIRRDGQNSAITANMMERLLEHRINTAPSAQPILRIIADKVNIHPSIKLSSDSDNKPTISEETRYNILMPIKIINIGNIPAQNIIIDAEVKFKKRKPLGYNSLPTHYYDFVDFLSPESTATDRSIHEGQISFDGFVAKELISDFFDGRVDWQGMAYLPTEKEFKDSSLWPSPIIKIRCIYSDIHGQNYCSEIQRFFHIWPDSEKGELGIYFLKMGEIGFQGITKIDDSFRNEYMTKRRSLRFSAFDGQVYEDGQLVLLVASKKKRIKSTAT